MNTDMDNALSQKDKDAIRAIIKNLYEVMEGYKGTVSKIRTLTKKKRHKKRHIRSELDVLREELRDASTTINHLQTNLNTSVSRPHNQVST